MERLKTLVPLSLTVSVAVLCVGAAAAKPKGLQGRFVGRAALDGVRKFAELDLVKTGSGIYRGGCTFRASLDDPGLSCSAEARDLGRNRVQVLLTCKDESRQEWRGNITQGGKKLTGKIEGTLPTLSGSFALRRSSQ